MTKDPIAQAAKLIASADALLITAGAGMGVDSGLPDFRGEEGFWAAYPALAKAKVPFEVIANPAAFRRDPRRAWGFYGHRLALYRQTVPHHGFQLLRRITGQLPQGAFVVTSNVDGQFQKAGFEELRILEIHGSIHRLQCSRPCRDFVWSAELVEPETDDERCQWSGVELPTCARCGDVARPNILMFDDLQWITTRLEIQRKYFEIWCDKALAPVVIEIGAGVDLPSIRRISETRGFPLIRINPRYPAVPEGMGVSLSFGAHKGLSMLVDALRRMDWLQN